MSHAKLQTAIEGVEGAMRDLIKTLTDMIQNATQPGQAGDTPIYGGPVNPSPDYLPGGLPGQVRSVPDMVRGGSPTGANGWTGLGFDFAGGGYLQSPTGDVFYLEPGIDFGAIGRRAMGGPVSGGSPYVVGELGPELFVPRSSGTVVPNDAMATSGAKNYTINVNMAGGQNIGREVVRAIEEYERRNGNGWRS